MLYIRACASRGDRRQALAFVCGTALGTALWAAFAAFAAAPLAAGAPLLLAGLKLSIGVALIVLGGRVILAASGPSGLKGADGRAAPPAAFAQGVLVTMASTNEVVFWSAMLALAVGAEPSPTFGGVLVAGVVVIALAFEGTLVWLATAGTVGRLIRRLRQPLEVALGVAFCATGAVLLRLV